MVGACADARPGIAGTLILPIDINVMYLLCSPRLLFASFVLLGPHYGITLLTLLVVHRTGLCVSLDGAWRLLLSNFYWHWQWHASVIIELALRFGHLACNLTLSLLDYPPLVRCGESFHVCNA